MPYINALYCGSIPSLADHREQLSCKFLKSVSHPSSCLHTLLTTPRDPTITTWLRSANKFPCLPAVPQNTRHWFLMLLPITKFHKRLITIHHPICCRCFIFFTVMYYTPYYVILDLLCYLVLWPQNWINSTTTMTDCHRCSYRCRY